jgi:hexosaminidase
MNPVIGATKFSSRPTMRRSTAVRQIVQLWQSRLRHRFRHLIWLALFLPDQGRATGPNIVPKPVSFTEGSGVFLLAPGTAIDADAASQETARRLKEALSPATGFDFAKPPGGNTIVIRKDPSLADLGTEGYDLEVTPTKIVIRSGGEAGQFYAVQTIRQMLPPPIYSKEPVRNCCWSIPVGHIQDRPRFVWRGVLLDEGRHFTGKQAVEQILDFMSTHKLNVLHWHLTEDQGWRIEIKKYPLLTQIGSQRAHSPVLGNPNLSDGIPYGGYFTQADIREIVAYAADRFITIVPEIEMPGHAAAALASYQQYGNTDIPNYKPEVATSWGVHPYDYAPKEETFTFLEDILQEVVELFPSEYIHIGGDEVPPDQWQASPFAQQLMKEHNFTTTAQLESWFVNRIEQFLNSKGRKLIGWDDIMGGNLSHTAAVMVWHNFQYAQPAFKNGNAVVLTPLEHLFLDLYQTDNKSVPQPVAGDGLNSLEAVYDFSPVPPDATPEETKLVLGVQGNVWTENVEDWLKIQYQLLPRACAVAEVAWTPQEARDFGDFQKRLGYDFERLNAMGLDYYGRTPGNLPFRWGPANLKPGTSAIVWPITGWIVTGPLPESGHWQVVPGDWKIHFTYQSGDALMIEKVEMLENGKPLAVDEHVAPAGPGYDNNAFQLHISTVDPTCRYSLRAWVRGVGGNDSNGYVTITPPNR